ncbi:MAG: DUF5104 domain-containing protein [Firmicutes bacterium]|nr:DUF5104 domain-containing protein [Bacillota bacterium]
MNKYNLSAAILVLALLSGCGSPGHWDDEAVTTQTDIKESTTEPTTESIADTPQQKRMTVEEVCESVLNAIQNEDTERLKVLFCDEIKNTHDIDKELTDFFEFKDGKFVFFTDYHQDVLGAGERKKGVYVKYHIDSRINVAKTDTGEKYQIDFYANLVFDDKPENIGLEYIVITNADGEELWVGEVLDN